MVSRLILAGSGPFADPIFKALTKAEVEIAAVVTQPDARAGRGRQLREQTISALARQQQIPVFKSASINAQDSLEQLKSLRADLLLTASFGQYIGPRVLEMFARGCWNLHPSLLPAYRGATPVNAALRDGLSTTGVTLFRLVKAMDAGPIAAAVRIHIAPAETAGELLSRCALRAGELAVKTLPALISGELSCREQDDSRATYCRKLEKQSGHLDWNLDAAMLTNLARSVDPWPGAWTSLRGRRLNLARFIVVEGGSANTAPGAILEATAQRIVISCRTGSVAPKLWQWEGKKTLSAQDFLNGTRLKVGDQLDQ